MTEKQERIIEKAKEVFLNKGLFDTVMGDIAQAVGLTRRTLYRHFETKEEIAYEAMMSFMKEWNDYNHLAYENLEGNGISRLEVFLNKLIDHMEAQPLVMKFLGEYDFYFKDEGPEEHVQLETEDFDEAIHESDNLILLLIQMGVIDGSICSTIEAELIEATISNVLWSFGQRIAIRSKRIQYETGIEAIRLIRNQVTMYIMAIKQK